jgi:DNA (cytosine-5)-methyltransferase 1
MFGLPMLRHRWFESSILLFAPGGCNHPDGFYMAVAGAIRGRGTLGSDKKYKGRDGRLKQRDSKPGKAAGVLAMGINWMTVSEMCQAIPPAYTEFIGSQLMNVLRVQS